MPKVAQIQFYIYVLRWILDKTKGNSRFRES